MILMVQIENKKNEDIENCFYYKEGKFKIVNITFLEQLLKTISFPEIFYLFLGAILTLFTTIILNLINEWKDNLGKLDIYYKNIPSSLFNQAWGFYENHAGGGISFRYPIWIEVYNTKNKPKIIRDLSLYLYNDNEFTYKMSFLDNKNNPDDSKPFGNGGSNSFVAQPYSVELYEFLYSVNGKQMEEKDFNEVRIGYYDERNKYIEYKLVDVKNSWTYGEREVSKKWKKLS